MEFNWPRREKYPSYLEVDLQFVGRAQFVCREQFVGKTGKIEIPRKHISRAPWEKEIGLVDYS